MLRSLRFKSQMFECRSLSWEPRGEGADGDLESFFTLAKPGVGGLNGGAHGLGFEPHMDGSESSRLDIETFCFKIFFGNADASVPLYDLAVLDR